MIGTDIIFSALSSQPENLQIELQAEQQNEYEKEYLEADLVSRIRTRNPSTNNFTIKSTTNIDTRRNCEPLINQDEDIRRDTCKKTGTNLMKYFYLKRFIQRIRNNRTKLSNVNENHIKLINDKSSDSQGMIQILKLNNHQHFQIHNVTKLFRDSTISSNVHPLIIWIREKYQQSRKSIYEILSKIPQIHPESLKKIIWDYWTILFRLLLLILIPLEIAYNPQILFEKLIGLTVTIIIILIVDNILRLNTICYMSGQAVYDRWQIIQVNLNLQTISDFALIFLLIYFIKNEGNQFQYLMLLISLTQHYQINQTLQKSEESQYFTKKQKAFINLFKLLIYLIYVLHLFSCIWFFNSSLNQRNSWIILKELDHQQWQLQYLEAFYFAIVTMLTIGYGDNVPKTWNEKIVAIFFILSACLWFSYSINAIGTIIKEINQHFMERSKKIRVINRYMHQRNIPFSLQHRIREYLTFRWKEEAEIDLQQEETLLNELSEELKQDLKKQANNVFFKHCDFLFKNFSLELQNSLSPFIKRKIILPQNTFSIYTLSEFYQPHLCFVEQGQLQYQNVLNVSLKTVQNQGQFLEVPEFIEENDEAQTFKAIGYVSLLVLSKSDFTYIIRQYPKDYQKYCNLKDQFVLQVKPKHLVFGQYCAACNTLKYSIFINLMSFFIYNCQNQQYKYQLECPNLSLSIDRELIIKRYQYSQDQYRNYTKRSKKRGKTSFSTRCDREIIEQFAIYFQNEQPKLVQNQLSKQLIQEQDFDDPKSDLNEQSPINKTFNFKRQESIQLPRGSLQSGEAISIQKQININDSIVSSDNNSIQNLKLSTRQQCMLTTNKFMSAKLSKYKKMCSQQNPKITLIDTDESLKIDIQDCIYQNIELLYFNFIANYQKDYNQKIKFIQCQFIKQIVIYDQQIQPQEYNFKFKKNLKYSTRQYNKIFNEEAMIPLDRSIYDLQILYFSFKAQQGIEQFEVVKNFSSYMVQHNIENIILQIEQKYHTLLLKPITQLIRFMYYPYEFIMKFQKVKTQRLKLLNYYKKRSSKNLKQKQSKINDLVRKWETPRKSYRFSVIIPNDE